MAKGKRARRGVAKGIAQVRATYHNTQVTISDFNGDVL